MYVDGHEREDVVKYRQAFIERWKQYEKRFHLWDNDGNPLPLPKGFPVPGAIGRFRLILVTHDESIFFQNDLQKSHWSHKSDKPTPSSKGDGQSVMVSEFLISDWGRLCDGDEFVSFLFKGLLCANYLCREARITFKPGVNRDGYFDSKKLINQVETAIDIFEGKTKGFAQGLFIFDNAPSHQKRADNALSARKMPKSLLALFISDL